MGPVMNQVESLFLIAWNMLYYQISSACWCYLLNHYNWFEFVERLEHQLSCDLEAIKWLLLGTPRLWNDSRISWISCTITQSISGLFQGYSRTERHINEEVVSDSDSEYEPIHDSSSMKDVLRKKRLALKRRARRLRAKLTAERRFLTRRILRQTSKIIEECPDIGEVIEKYVEDHSVGADAWRRTGLPTFDGNSKLQDKVTYKKTKGHLQEV